MSDSERAGARLDLLGLTKHYGAVVAVDAVDLVVEPGEFITLLGPSGSGKTTIMMMIAGFIEPTAGQILVDGDDIAGVAPERRNIGMVFQNYALFPHMTVFDNIAFPLKMRRWPKNHIAEAVRDALGIVRLEGFAARFPRQLSGGQQQRVALARALVYRPPVLLMDEPLGALDKKLREELQIEIKHIQSQLGLTVIYVTHDQSEALTMSDRIAVMDRGQVLQLGHPDDLYQRPATRFVADFIGDSNFLAGTIVARADDRDVVETPTNLRFHIPHLDGARTGDRIECALRPERVMLTANGQADNTFPATIVERIYLGELTKLRVALPSGEQLTVSQQNRQGSGDLADGQEVTVGWKCADAVIVARHESRESEVGSRK
ncbi:MAG: ABC transporter ATP-binding protein [Thermomicrobiales bacterium]